jgi:2-haloacid dehalogenase
MPTATNQANTMIQAVIFDIGNVLIRWDPEGFYDRVIGPDARRRLFAETDPHAMNEQVDRGAPFRATIYAHADQHPAWTAELRMWHDRWEELAGPALPDSLTLMRALQKAGIPVFALTNFGHDSFAHALTIYPFLAEFDRAYVSGRMGLTKPDPAIYAAVEQDCGLPPERLLFTDDRADNIAAAAARGWGVHHFTGPQGLRDRLHAEGLLAEGPDP